MNWEKKKTINTLFQKVSEKINLHDAWKTAWLVLSIEAEKHTGGEKLMSIKDMIDMIVLRHKVRKPKTDSIYIAFKTICLSWEI